MSKKPIEQWTRDDYADEASRITREPPESETSRIGAMMLMSTTVGSKSSSLRVPLGDWWDSLKPFHKNLRVNRVFMPNGQVAGEQWFDENDGRLAFLMDICVAQGKMRRTRSSGATAKVGAQ